MLKRLFDRRCGNRLRFILIMALLTVCLLGGYSRNVHAFVHTEYSFPGKIVIASPANGYKTTGSKISILGTAADADAPLYVNGEQILTTEHGFFSAYISLKTGTNEIEIKNGDDLYMLTVYRIAESGGSSSPKYTAYPEDTYGIVTSDYAMTRATISSQSPELIPLSTGTELRLLGEHGNFYKIYDGTFVSKSSIRKYSRRMELNEIAEAWIEENSSSHILSLKISCSLNTAYSVAAAENSWTITLYETDACPAVKYAANDAVKKVKVTSDSKLHQTYIKMELRRADALTGYDCSYADGVMTISMKEQPHPENEQVLRYLDSFDSIAEFNDACLQHTLRPLQGTVVVLDAGHGGVATGALGPLGSYGPVEKQTNLEITLEAAKRLEALGAEVVLTRSTDVDISLDARVATIRKVVPDISVSVHGNSLSQESNFGPINGFTTFYTYKGLGNAVPLINNAIFERLSERYNFKYRTEERKSLSLTRLTACPAILLETCYLSNVEDYELLLNHTFRREFGDVIADAISEYLYTGALPVRNSPPKVKLLY